MDFYIAIGILLLLIIFCIYMIVVTSNAKKKQKQKIKELKGNGMLTNGIFSHTSGLPIAEGLWCEMYSYPDRIEFKSGTTNITLARNKITDMCIKTDVEIQQQIVSNPGGAIAGAMAFGAIGAIVGGKSKTKNIKTTTSYLIITFINNQEELSYIIFNSTNNSSAYKFIKEFRELNVTSGAQIEL